ncbi:hypothetical protein NLJ89_g8639 [Agrocybe chaxingu]|uniref:Uncharacterized protein n=1 Tax=Agrocybe chaxingu TaxID=84603 RepID=A0A9W8JUH9_9AGAR|nr:hypothetical protein NLJ89_g8639 [Agrocybe chaxingu]
MICGGDSFRLKLLVSSLAFLETAHTALISAAIYYDTVTTWRLQPSTNNTYPLSIATIVENLIATMVQVFIGPCPSGAELDLFFLSALFSPAHLEVIWRAITRGPCVLRSCRPALHWCVHSRYIGIRDVAFDGGTGIFVVRISWLITAGLAVGGTADLLIAASMIYYLRKLSSPINLRSTGQIIGRLVGWSVRK